MLYSFKLSKDKLLGPMHVTFPKYSHQRSAKGHRNWPNLKDFSNLLWALKIRGNLKTNLWSPHKNNRITILSKEDAQDREFHLFFGRIEETINCF